MTTTIIPKGKVATTICIHAAILAPVNAHFTGSPLSRNIEWVIDHIPFNTGGYNVIKIEKKYNHE